MQPATFTAVLAALLGVCCSLPGCRKPGKLTAYNPREVPKISSERLTRTTIVPTLDTPLPKSGNALWCATFQAAWNRAKDEAVRDSLRIANAQQIADSLNRSPVTEQVLPPGSYYAVAGRLRDGIIATIHRDMLRQFPGMQPPRFEGAAGFVAYAYLDTKAEFTTPFLEIKRPISFSDAAGNQYPVSGFGLQEGLVAVHFPSRPGRGDCGGIGLF